MGKKIESEIGADEGVDTLGRWLSHYLSEVITEAENNPESQDQCVDLILQLWKHRSSFPHGRRPFENYENVLTALDRLSPSSNRSFYFETFLERAANKDRSTWVEAATKIDEIAKILISFCLTRDPAAKALDQDEWLEASKSIEPDPQLLALRRIAELKQEVDTTPANPAAEQSSSLLRMLDEFSESIQMVRSAIQEEDDFKRE